MWTEYIRMTCTRPTQFPELGGSDIDRITYVLQPGSEMLAQTRAQMEKEGYSITEELCKTIPENQWGRPNPNL
eukprot:g45218.t1